MNEIRQTSMIMTGKNIDREKSSLSNTELVNKFGIRSENYKQMMRLLHQLYLKREQDNTSMFVKRQ